ncbi:HAD family hydrolase [Brevundimonas sp. Root1279]|uniref:HAD family hydrolase n=1 Tax=Brevundimonas sp. Root1279 TaxID=1736443 RepID=UPI0006F6984A|nr:HAD family phosphatase [Brevundimonas sp. Root1279]KQW84163.1 haloacid dehalogenase [Brevundimonas sp. Root1279]
MSRYDLIVFDYDGVVADSELLNNRVLAELLTECGLATSLDDSLSIYMGKRWLDCVPLIEERLGGPCPDHVHGEWTRRCHDRATTELTPVAGFLDFLASRRERRCIASSSPVSWIEMGLERFGVGATFGGPIFSAAVHVTRGKPHPDLFLHAASALAIEPERALVIEDTPTGVRAGVAAGMTVVGLCAGGHIRDGHAERLLAAGAHEVVGSYAEIEVLLGR